MKSTILTNGLSIAFVLFFGFNIFLTRKSEIKTNKRIDTLELLLKGIYNNVPSDGCDLSNIESKLDDLEDDLSAIKSDVSAIYFK